MALDQTIVQGLTISIETVINSALRYDPSSRQKIAQIDQILAVKITPLALTLYLRGQQEGLAVLSYCEEPISTQLEGSPTALLHLLKQPTSLAGSGVTLTGSVGLLQQWQSILHTLDIDWEDAISQVLGDIAGPLTASGVRSSAHWAKTQMQEQQRLLVEYLQEELKLTPSQAEANHFYEAIDHLNLDVDRLTARLKNLQQQFANKNPSSPKEDTE